MLSPREQLRRMKAMRDTLQGLIVGNSDFLRDMESDLAMELDEEQMQGHPGLRHDMRILESRGKRHDELLDDLWNRIN